MRRKSVLAVISTSAFCALVIHAGNSPIAVAADTVFSSGRGVASNPGVAALPAAFAVGVAGSLVCNAAWDYARHRNWVWALADSDVDVRAERAFDF